MNIRIAKKEDIKKLALIYVDAYNSIDIGENWDTQSAEKLLKSLYLHQPDLTFVAEEKGEIVGGINAVIRPWWDGNHITDGELFVSPKYQGKGIGKKLIARLFSKAKDKYQAVSWSTYTHVVHEHPLKWYKGMGFNEVKEWTMIAGDIDKVLARIKE